MSFLFVCLFLANFHLHSVLPSASSAWSLGSVLSKLCGSGCSGGSSGSGSVLATSQRATWVKQPATHVRPISFHIPRQAHWLLLRVRRRFRDFLGHCRRLDLKGWTFQISNSSALGPSMFFPYFPISTRFQHQRKHKKTMSQEGTGGSTGTGCDLVLGRIRAFPSFVETSVPFSAANLERQTAGIWFWGHNAQPTKTTRQGTSIVTGFWSSPVDLLLLVMLSHPTSTSWWRILWVYLLANTKKHERNVKKHSCNNGSSLLCQALCLWGINDLQLNSKIWKATSDKCNQAECTSNCLNQCPTALWWSHLQMGTACCLLSNTSFPGIEWFYQSVCVKNDLRF